MYFWLYFCSQYLSGYYIGIIFSIVFLFTKFKSNRSGGVVWRSTVPLEGSLGVEEPQAPPLLTSER